MNATTRMELKDEIIRTREKFQRWLITIPECVLQNPSKDPHWTNAEMLYRISVSPLIIKSALQKNHKNGSTIVHPLLATGSTILKTHEIFIRSHARDITLWEIAKEYEENCNIVLGLLQSMEEESFENVPVIVEEEPILSGGVAVEQLFHFVKSYFDIHRIQIKTKT